LHNPVAVARLSNFFVPPTIFQGFLNSTATTKKPQLVKTWKLKDLENLVPVLFLDEKLSLEVFPGPEETWISQQKKTTCETLHFKCQRKVSRHLTDSIPLHYGDLILIHRPSPTVPRGVMKAHFSKNGGHLYLAKKK